jgi:hypothetical protein
MMPSLSETIGVSAAGGGALSIAGASGIVSSNKSIASSVTPPMDVPAGFQQHAIYQHPLSTPWTLGSTDGTYAIQLQIMQQQQLLEQQEGNPQAWNNGDGAAADGDGAAAVAEGPTGVADVKLLPDGETTPTQDAVRSVAVGSGGGVEITPTGEAAAASNAALEALHSKQSLYQDRLFRQPSASVEAVLAASCEVMGFDISEMWLRTGPKTHQLTNSHLRPTALEDSVRKDLVDVYYGDKSSERTHRLSPALCKRAKEANDVVWVTAHTPHGAEALRCSISNVRTAVAVPVCHEASNTNITIIFFSIRRYVQYSGAMWSGVECMDFPYARLIFKVIIVGRPRLTLYF